MRAFIRILTFGLPFFALTVTVSGCGAVGDIDTATMQTTNRLVGAPLNGPGNPPSPPHQSGLVK